MAKKGSRKTAALTAEAPKAGKIDIKALRSKVEKKFEERGWKLNESHFARLVGASVQTVKGWVEGTAPRGKSIGKIQALEAKADSNKFDESDAPLKRGRKVGGAKGTASAPKMKAKPTPKLGAKRGRPATASAGNGTKPELLGVIESMLRYALSCSDPRPSIQTALKFIEEAR